MLDELRKLLINVLLFPLTILQFQNVTLIRELRNPRYANNSPVYHSISSFDPALEIACSLSDSSTAF